MQACRGSKSDPGCLTTCDGPGDVDERNNVRISIEADFLYAYSTAPGNIITQLLFYVSEY